MKEKILIVDDDANIREGVGDILDASGYETAQAASCAEAVAQIKKLNPGVIGIYDVRTDVEVFSILGFYRSLCTEVSARAFALAAVPAGP